MRLQWYGEGRYYGPAAWEPTAPYFFYPPEEPFAPTWKTWFLDTPRQFRPTPSVFGSKRYLDDLFEVLEVQRNLTAAQKDIAKHCADGRGSATPPGHWNQIALQLAAQANLDEGQRVALFSVLNRALADAFIAAWDAKYAYWTARPVTAANQLLCTTIQPFILTPAFPSYLSGHNTVRLSTILTNRK